jgi:hypothetical protein
MLVHYESLFASCALIVEVGTVRIIVLVNIIVVFLFMVLIVVGDRTLSFVIGPGASHNGFSHATNPIVLLRLGIRIEQIAGVGGGNFKGMALAGLEVGRFDRRAN